jgi:hypothetical protein
MAAIIQPRLLRGLDGGGAVMTGGGEIPPEEKFVSIMGENYFKKCRRATGFVFMSFGLLKNVAKAAQGASGTNNVDEFRLRMSGKQASIRYDGGRETLEGVAAAIRLR